MYTMTAAGKKATESARSVSNGNGNCGGIRRLGKTTQMQFVLKNKMPCSEIKSDKHGGSADKAAVKGHSGVFVYLVFTNLHEPVYGSCGTAKASYPMKDILNYCALRSAQDALSTGWQRLDTDIKREQERERDREARGEVLVQKLNPRTRYVQLFDGKRTIDPKMVGKDKLFLSIAHDVDVADDANLGKVEAFVDALLALIEKTIEEGNKGYSPDGVKLNEPWAKKFVSAASNAAAGNEKLPSQSQMEKLVKTKRMAVANFLQDVDGMTENAAYDLLGQVCPLDMGDINPANAASIFGMFTKVNENGQRVFVHPIAMRYMLYKLAAALRAKRNPDDLATLRTAAENGYGSGVAKIDFDNTRTHGADKQEETPEEYLASRAFLQGEEGFIRSFAEKYAAHMDGQYKLCVKYANEMLLQAMLPNLLQYVETLTKQVESFFSSLSVVANTLAVYTEKNLAKNEHPEQKTIYVCASAAEKEAMYQSLELDVGGSSSAINQVVAETVYGQFCAIESPMSEANEKYKDASLATTFYNQVTRYYRELILEDNDLREKIDLDIYTALCRSVDFAVAADAEKQKQQNAAVLSVGADGVATVERNDMQRAYENALIDLKDKLQSLGAPMLYSRSVQKIDNQTSDVYDPNAVSVRLPVKRSISFWGYNGALRAACPAVNGILGINGSDGEDTHYAKGDLYYYIAEYGILPKYIPKLAEPLDSELASSDSNEGLYYKHYQAKINSIHERMASGNFNVETALLDTPHLDKTWHTFLPYISAEKQREEDGKFLRLFWLAVAYGMITIKRNIDLNNREYFYIARTAKNAIRTYAEPQMARFNGEPIVATNVYALVESLRTDAIFLHDAAALEATLADELAKLSNYEDTKLLRGDAGVGGLAAASEMNAATMIIRYANAPQSRATAVDELAAAVEELLKEMIAVKYAEGRTKSVDSVMRGLCNRIYVASPMKKDDLSCFANWVRASKETNVEKENEE